MWDIDTCFVDEKLQQSITFESDWIVKVANSPLFDNYILDSARGMKS